ncbi:hypothetical protein [Cytobacillus dafuensis]|nr:hypothetical protein [Cytobacillus dafuensis]
MKKNKNMKAKETANLEIGMEFGDINASKQYEVPFMNEDKGKRKNKK